VHFKRGRFAAAEQASARALALSPSEATAAYNRALAWACGGQTDSAARAWRALLRGARDTGGLESALADIAQHGAAGGSGAEQAARVFLEAAGLRAGARGALPDSLMPRARAALEAAARTWPRLAALAGKENSP